MVIFALRQNAWPVSFFISLSPAQKRPARSKCKRYGSCSTPEGGLRIRERARAPTVQARYSCNTCRASAMRRKRIDVVRNRSTHGRARDQVSPRRAAAPTCAEQVRVGRAHAQRLGALSLGPAVRTSHPLGPVSRTAGGISSHPLALGGRSLYSADMDASVACERARKSQGMAIGTEQSPADSRDPGALRVGQRLARLADHQWANDIRVAAAALAAAAKQRAVHCSRRAGCAAGVTRLSHERSDVHPDGRGVRPRVGGRSLACLLADSSAFYRRLARSGLYLVCQQPAVLARWWLRPSWGRCIGGDAKRSFARSCIAREWVCWR